MPLFLAPVVNIPPLRPTGVQRPLVGPTDYKNVSHVSLNNSIYLLACFLRLRYEHLTNLQARLPPAHNYYSHL